MTLKNPGPKKSFKFKASSSGLLDTSSSFTVTHPTTGTTYWILSNTNIQSAHHDHLYYAPDVIVCLESAAVTKLQKSNRRYSYVENKGLITFVEVKHLTPFPEVLYSFSGLIQEFMPHFLWGFVNVSDNSEHLTPMIVFTGAASPHVRKIQTEHTTRYGINIVFNTQGSNGQIANLQSLLKYDPSLGTHAQSGKLIEGGRI